MAEKATLPEPPDLTQTVFAALEDKARLPIASLLVLGTLAGMYIGLGGLFATVALAGTEDLPFGGAQVLAGVAFSVGLALVLIAGAELFTGNTLMAGPILAGRVSPAVALRALGVVYVANLVGSLALATVVFLAGVHEAGEGAVGQAAIELGLTKIDKTFGTVFASGIVANMLVCLAVWMAYAGNTVTEKFVALLLPIAAFVAAGLEHSVANMYLLPYAFYVDAGSAQTPGAMTLGGIVANLVSATLGNIVGGSLIAIAYGYIYPRT